MSVFIKDYFDFLDMVEIHLKAMSHYALVDDDAGYDKAHARLDDLYAAYPEYEKRELLEIKQRREAREAV